MEVWGHHFQKFCIIFHSDNQAIVHVINKQTSKKPKVMALVRRLVLVCLEKNISMQAKHIPGNYNVLPDLLSRFQVQEFLKQAPYMDQDPTVISSSLLDDFSIQGLR